MADSTTAHADAAGTVNVGGDLTVNRVGFGAMRLTGEGIWGQPADRQEAKAVLRRAIELGVNFIDRHRRLLRAPRQRGADQRCALPVPR